jgi:hypothetical protein
VPDNPLYDVPRRGRSECKVADHDDIEGRDLLKSTPADPKQKVGNGDRTPEPYVNRRVEPDLTGFYFEAFGRYRLLVNHVGGHLECLLTLVSIDSQYTLPFQKAGQRDKRLPKRWGPISTGQHPPPIAFRFSGQSLGDGQYLLTVQPWMLRDTSHPTNMIGVGILRVASFGIIGVEFEDDFLRAWPEHRDAKSCQLNRTDTRPVLLDRYLDLESVPFAFRSQLWFPLTHIQQGALSDHAKQVSRMAVRVDDDFKVVRSGGRKLTLVELIRAADGISRGANEYRIKHIALAIDRLVRDTFLAPVTVKVEDGGITLDDVDLLGQPMFDELARLEIEPGRSALVSIQRILDDAHLLDADVPALGKHLGLGKRGWGRHRYEIEFEGLDVVDVGGETDIDRTKRKRKYKALKKILKSILKKSENRVVKALLAVMKTLPSAWVVGHATIRYTGVSEWNSPDDGGRLKETPSEAVFGVLMAGVGLSESTPTLHKFAG